MSDPGWLFGSVSEPLLQPSHEKRARPCDPVLYGGQGTAHVGHNTLELHIWHLAFAPREVTHKCHFPGPQSSPPYFSHEIWTGKLSLEAPRSTGNSPFPRSAFVHAALHEFYILPWPNSDVKAHLKEDHAG